MLTNVSLLMKSLGFVEDRPDLWMIFNRSVAYDNDCSDDERDDSFYEQYSSMFNSWANQTIDNLRAELAKLGINEVEITKSVEYGLVMAKLRSNT